MVKTISADGVENALQGPPEKIAFYKIVCTAKDGDSKMNLKHSGCLFFAQGHCLIYFWLCPTTFGNVPTFSKVMGHSPQF